MNEADFAPPKPFFNPPQQTVRWGIIGCGDVTEVKSGPGFQKATGSELVAVMRRDAAKAADYARRHGVTSWYDDADRLIGDAQVDAVYIATPPGMHEYYAMKVCAAGKPCYVEKPMSRNAMEARRMVEAFAAKRIPLFVAYYRRGQARFIKAKEIVESGVLGRLQSVQYRYTDGQMRQPIDPVPWRLQAEHAGGGLFLDLGSHAIDLLDFFAGPLKDVAGHAQNIARQFDVEDEVNLTFATRDGVRGSANWSFIGDRRDDEFLVAGDLAELRFPCFTAGPLRVRYADGRSETFDPHTPKHVQQPLIEMMVDELLGIRGTCPSTGESGLRAQEIIDQALQGYYGGREDGFWKRAWPGSK